MEMLRKTFDFLGLCCALLCSAGGFYFVSNNYYVIDGKMVDFSLGAWGGMLVLWGVGLWRYCHKKAFGVMFAMAVSVVTAAFDCYRFAMYAGSLECVYYIRFLILGEIAFLAVLLWLKFWEGARFIAAVILLSYFGAVLIYPQICSLKYIYVVAGGYAVLWLVYLHVAAKGGRWIVCLGTGGFLLILCGMGVLFYLRTPGIRFYEPKVTNEAQNVKVSVIVPVYNVEDVIERCLDSLRRQSLKEIEIIAVDDGSTDKTPEILARYAAHDARIKVISQENAYIGAARNRGLGVAKGEYVGFVDSDDFVSEDFYQTLYEAAVAQNKDVAITGGVDIVWQVIPVFQKITKKNVQYLSLNKEKILNMHEQYSGYVWNKIYKKSFLLDNDILFTTYRTIYEDTFFAIVLFIHLDDMALAKRGVYYHSVRERFTVSSSKLKLSDKIFEMLAALERKVKAAKVDEVKRKKGVELLEKITAHHLNNFYEAITEEDKTKFYGLCSEWLAAEVCRKAMGRKQKDGTVAGEGVDDE